MRKQFLVFIFAVSAAILACGPLSSSAGEAERALEELAPTLEAAMGSNSLAEESQSNLPGDSQVAESADNEFCNILTIDDIKSVLGAESVSASQHTVGPDQATCGYTLDASRILSMRIDAQSPARSAMTVYEKAYVESFGIGAAVEDVEGPWTEGFWNADYKGIFTVKDDEVAFSIQYPGGDASSRDGIVQLAKLFFERLP